MIPGATVFADAFVSQPALSDFGSDKAGFCVAMHP